MSLSGQLSALETRKSRKSLWGKLEICTSAAEQFAEKGAVGVIPLPRERERDLLFAQRLRKKQIPPAKGARGMTI
jgi:hypothetical protein